MSLVLELFDELAELIVKVVHGPLDADQQVERHGDREADAGDCREEILLWDYLGDYCVCQVIRQGRRKAGDMQERKGIAYLNEQEFDFKCGFMGDSSAGGYQRRMVVRRDHRRVLEGRGRCLDFMICD